MSNFLELDYLIVLLGWLLTTMLLPSMSEVANVMGLFW